MITSTSNSIDARSDIQSRLFSMLIIVPIVCFTSYSWLIERVIDDGISLKDVGWLMINGSGLLVMIAGSIFMRGHNNRNLLFLEVFWPIIFWFLFFNIGSWLVDIGLHYIGLYLGFVLHVCTLFYISFRVHIESKVLYWFGKYIAPLCGSKKEKLQDYAIRSVRSKGRTNYQFAMLAIYSVNTLLWGAFAVTLTWGGIATDVPFYLVDAPIEDKLSTNITAYYGFDIGEFILSTLYDFANTAFAGIMVYYILTDYITPDKVGHDDKVVNHVGHGARELIM